MGLDTRYIPASYLQEYFVDKDTGMPLAGGKIYFYKDQARTIAKPVYKLSGSPPNYTYTELPNPCVLNINGNFVDADGHDIVPYFKAFDDTGLTELYYITVYSSTNIFQFSREGEPNVGSQEGQDLANYIPNGQFSIANVIPNGRIWVSGAYPVAFGNWYFGRSEAGAEDYVTQYRLAPPFAIPFGNPRQALRVNCTVPNPTETWKTLYVKYYDANKFASATQKYTYSFSAKSNSASPIAVTVVVIRNYGAGGSPQEYIGSTSIVIPVTWTNYNIPFLLGTTIGKTFGLGNDDSVEFHIFFPATSLFDILLTNCAITKGEITLTNFPVTTENQFVWQSIAGSIISPMTTGTTNLGLPLVLTQAGVDYDRGQIGTIEPIVYRTLSGNRLRCDGAQYDNASYSSILIPYSRLGNVMWQAGLDFGLDYIPICGTGLDYVTATRYDTSSTALRIEPNKNGATSSAVDGATPTGFTFSDLTTGSATNGLWARIEGSTLVIQSITDGAIFGIYGAGTSGFTITEVEIGTATTKEINTVDIASISGLASKYFYASSLTTQYYVWFTFDGVGTDPAPGGTGIKVALFNYHHVIDALVLIRDALNGVYACEIETVAGSSMTAGSYFKFYTPDGLLYVPWYTVDGVGTQPTIMGTTKYLPVAVIFSDFPADVLQKTMIAINQAYFAVPDLRGAFVRGWDDVANRDPDKNTRYAYGGGPAGNNPGSWQGSIFTSHNHTYFKCAHPPGESSSGSANNKVREVGDTPTTNTGGAETRPLNIYLNYIIRY